MKSNYYYQTRYDSDKIHVSENYIILQDGSGEITSNTRSERNIYFMGYWYEK